MPKRINQPNTQDDRRKPQDGPSPTRRSNGLEPSNGEIDVPFLEQLAARGLTLESITVLADCNLKRLKINAPWPLANAKCGDANPRPRDGAAPS